MRTRRARERERNKRERVRGLEVWEKIIKFTWSERKGWNISCCRSLSIATHTLSLSPSLPNSSSSQGTSTVVLPGCPGDAELSFELQPADAMAVTPLLALSKLVPVGRCREGRMRAA